MLHPRTKQEDFEELQRLKCRLVKRAENGRYNSQLKLDKAFARLEGRFKDRIHKSDEYLFDDLETLQTFLRDQGLRPLTPETIHHESEHAEGTRSLGYKLKFGFYALQAGTNKIAIRPFVQHYETDTGDIIKIKNAPSELSDFDQLIL